MNKICTYVSTTLCTILFFLTTAQAQNNKPIQIGFGTSTSLHQPIVVNVHDVAMDPDGDYIYINYTNFNPSQEITILSDTAFEYRPALEDCGVWPFLIIVCDTSLVYQNSLCDSFWYEIDVECTWPPVVLNNQHPADTVCDGETVLYAPSTGGGSNVHRITLTSSNPNDVFARDPYDIFNTTTGIMTYHGFGERYISIMIEDQNSNEVITGIPYTTVNVYPNRGGELDTDSTYANSIGILPTFNNPDYWDHIITWLDGDGNVIKSTSLNAQSSLQEITNASVLSVDTPGFYTLTVDDIITGCISSSSAYYTGMNHPVSFDEIGVINFNTTLSNPAVLIETYYDGIYDSENDLNNGRIKFTNTITNPTKGTVSYIGGEMYYTPNGQCGVDTFLAIGCDTSHFLPHTTCDTIMVVMNIDCEINVLAFSTMSPFCNGGTEGAVQAEVQGANIDTNQITYLWSNGATTASLSGLTAGTYTVTVTYLGSITASAIVVVTQPQPLVGNVSVVNPCGPICSGSITSIVTGGTPPYTFLWSNGSIANGLQNLCAGMWYNATVTDMNACTASLYANVVEETSGIVVSLTKHDIDCDSTQGSIATIVSGGVAPYNYVWSTGSASSTISSLQTGTYNITVSDATGCVSTATETILNLSGLNVAVADSTLPSCFGINNGYVRVAASGGLTPYIYAWSGSASTADSADDLSSGSHSIIVTDGGGCTYVHYFYLPTQYALTFNDTVINAACIPDQLGEVNANTINGTAPYAYEWSNGATTSNINVPAGVYQYTVTDATGCIGQNAVTVTNYSLFVSAYAYPENCEQVNGSLNVVAYNGTPPYSYLWNNNPVLNSNTHSNLSSGNYIVKVTDSKGCYITASVTIEDDCHSVIAGNIYVDVNGNCLRDTGEMQQTSAMIVKASNGTHDYYGNINQYGVYNVMVYDTGVFSITIGPIACYTVCNVTPVYVAAFNQTYNIPQVGIIPSSTSHNFSAHLTGNGFNPGFNATYYVSATSYSNPNNISGTITLTYDPELIFASAPAGGVVDLNAQTVTWTNVTIPTSPGFINLSATFVLPIATPIGTLLHTTLHVAPDSNDCNPQNNSITITRPVTGSYDPNMKEVSPATEILETDSVLHYTIHFQNTGNDTTHFVILKDTLSDLVDPASFEFGGSSHQPCRYEVSGTGILTFTFDPIYLPDSATNEEGSKGFVSYSIKKKATTEIGEVIRNTAHIYFDFNPAIVTNTTENEVTTLVSIHGIKANDNLTAKVYPNPFSETATIELSEELADAKLVVTNLAGQVVQEYSSDSGSKWQINKQGLSQGMYTFTIYSSGKPMLRGKLIAE